MFIPSLKCPSCGQDREFRAKFSVSGDIKNESFVVCHNFRDLFVATNIQALPSDTVVICKKCKNIGYLAEYKKEARKIQEQISSLVESLNKEWYTPKEAQDPVSENNE